MIKYYAVSVLLILMCSCYFHSSPYHRQCDYHSDERKSRAVALTFTTMNEIVSVLFLLLLLIVIYLQYKRENNIINAVSLLAAPYFFIVLFNNFFAYRFGYYKIRDEVLFMIASSIVCFAIGAYFATPMQNMKIAEEENISRFEFYDMEAMKNVLLFIGIIEMARLAFVYRQGAFSPSNFEESEGLMGNGPFGHLLLLSHSIAPIVFLYWLDHKNDWKSLLGVLFIAIVRFSSFIKYNILGFLVSLFIFVSIYKKSIVKKSVTLLIIFTLGIFVLNYLIGFLLRGANVPISFYLNHFWNYAAGSSIYDNYIFTLRLEGADNSIFYKIGTFIFGLPNMFINKLFGTVCFPHVTKSARMIGTIYGQSSNVVDAFGYLFPAYNQIEIVAFYIITILFGIISTSIYSKQMKKKYKFNTLVCNYFSYFVFFSFFGTFYINAGPWEILVYSITIPPLFHKRTKIRKGRIVL